MNRFTQPLTIDVHQHLWPAQLIAALRARRSPPRLVDWTLQLGGEPDFLVDPRHHDVDARSALAHQDGLELALVSLPSSLGIEHLPAAEASELLDAYHTGARALPRPFGAWAAASVSEVDPDGLRRRLGEGFVGLQLPATALVDEAGYERAAPLLEVLASDGRPLLIHPGPAQGAHGMPVWWPAMVSYVAQMHAAWFAFLAWGRRRHPGLRVCFAMLAGLAPLHGERATARGGPRPVFDEHLFLDTSSYGPRAIDAVVRVLGIDALVNGSDRPYAAPVPVEGEAAGFAIRRANPSRLLHPKEVSDERTSATRA